MLCHSFRRRTRRGGGGALLIPLSPHSFRVESSIYKGADPLLSPLRLRRAIVMRVSYQLFKVVMRSIKTSLGGVEGWRCAIHKSERKGIPYLFIKQPSLLLLLILLSLLLSISRPLSTQRSAPAAFFFLAASHVNNKGSPLLEPQHLGSSANSPSDSVVSIR